MNLALKELGDFVTLALPDEVTHWEIKLDELSISVSPDSILKVLKFLRDDAHCQFRQIVDICGVDYPERTPRFNVVYHLLSMTHNFRIRIKVGVEEDQAMPSACDLFSTSNWFEREVWDMFGIPFTGHPDLRRILTDYGFEGHPLRKDFPLTGYVEMRYDEQKKRVVYEPVTLVQDFRTFDFMSPWEGVAPLPGDEKADLPENSEGK